MIQERKEKGTLKCRILSWFNMSIFKYIKSFDQHRFLFRVYNCISVTECFHLQCHLGKISLKSVAKKGSIFL